jgi:hypothetical protein
VTRPIHLDIFGGKRKSISPVDVDTKLTIFVKSNLTGELINIKGSFSVLQDKLLTLVVVVFLLKFLKLFYFFQFFKYKKIHEELLEIYDQREVAENW